MKKLALSAIALAALGMAGPAIAADMAVRPVARAVPFTNWTGCYIGGQVGASWGHSDGYFATGASTIPNPTIHSVLPFAGQARSDEMNMSGLIGGVYGGCNYQIGVWVLGFEGDWSATNKEGQARRAAGTSVPDPITGFVGLSYYEAQERWLATARGRLGYAVDKWLFFVSGGAAWAKIDSEHTGIFAIRETGPLAGQPFGGPPAAAVRESDTRLGWTVGAGLDYLVGYGWSIRAEYLFVSIPRYTTFVPGSATFNDNGRFATNLDVKLNDHIVRFGLAYKFWPWGAVVR